MSLDRDLLSSLVELMEEDRETMVPTRLSILIYLYFTQNANFTILQKKLGLTSGNLSSHLRKLEELNLIRISKRFVELKPTTIVSLTQDGAKQVRDQMLRMRELVSKVIEKDLNDSEE
ncbi:MAG: transcriptional regulator [Candidatus Thorarchaeota archaeon]|nr:transcriptional regulator [Candidatus Thorarchaeota archaeon]